MNKSKNLQKTKTQKRIFSVLANDLVQITITSLLAIATLFVWWKFYQEPINNYQKKQNKISLEQVNKPEYQDFNTITIKNTISTKSEIQEEQQIPQPKKITIENDFLKLAIDLRGLKINDLLLKKYNQNPNNNGNNNLVLLSNTAKPYDEEYGFVDIGFASADNKLTLGKDTPNENSIWSLASYSDISFISKYLPTNLDIGLNLNTDDETNKIEQQKSNIMDQIKTNIANGSILLKWKGSTGLEFFVIITKPTNNNPYLLKLISFTINRSINTMNFYMYGRINKTATNEQINSSSIVHQGLTAYTSSGITDKKFKDIKSEPFIISPNISTKTQNTWLGFNTKYWFYGFYFNNAAVLDLDSARTLQKIKNINGIRIIEDKSQQIDFAYNLQNKKNIDNKIYQIDFATKPIELTPNQVYLSDSEIYLGAKDLKIVSSPYYKKYHLFDRTIDFGIFYIITKPMMLALEFINKILGNYGYSIILLTIFIKILLYPLSAKSYMSMAKMKKLSPIVNEIKLKNKNNKQLLQKEIAALYKAEGVNPASGCLPLLLQMPVFFAIYKILIISLTLRHSPFILWVQDLSARDPLSIFNLFGFLKINLPSFLVVGPLPIIMGITMYLQQKLSPQTDNPLFNSSTLKFVPIVVTFIFASFPAGLLLYWITNNIFSITQQLYFEKVSARQIKLSGKRP